MPKEKKIEKFYYWWIGENKIRYQIDYNNGYSISGTLNSINELKSLENTTGIKAQKIKGG